MLGTTWG